MNASATTKPEAAPSRQRDRGDGSIFKIPRSRFWYIQFYVNCRAVRMSSGTEDYDEARKLLKRKIAEVQTETFTPVRLDKIRVSELYEDAHLSYRTRGNKSTAHLVARWTLHLAPFFGAFKGPDGRWQGGKFASEVTTRLVNRYITHRQSENAANATIRRELAALRRMFRIAHRSNPPKVKTVPSWEMPGRDSDNVREGFLAIRDYERLAAECAKHGVWMRTIFEIGYRWGWRKEEILGLRVRQVDLFHNEVRLPPNTTKNRKGRTVTMLPLIRELLAACIHCKAPQDHVFTRGRNNDAVSNFRNTWYAVCCASEVGKMCCPECVSDEDRKPIPLKDHKCPRCKAWIPKHQQRYSGLIFHDLRRTAIRGMIEAGIPTQVAMKISGHETESVFARYAIVSQSEIAPAMTKLEAYHREMQRQLKEEDAAFTAQTGTYQ
jgi:integrase